MYFTAKIILKILVEGVITVTGTDVLRDEHKVIIKMLDVLKECGKKIEDGNLTEINTVKKAVDVWNKADCLI